MVSILDWKDFPGTVGFNWPSFKCKCFGFFLTSRGTPLILHVKCGSVVGNTAQTGIRCLGCASWCAKSSPEWMWIEMSSPHQMITHIYQVFPPKVSFPIEIKSRKVFYKQPTTWYSCMVVTVCTTLVWFCAYIWYEPHNIFMRLGCWRSSA